MSSIDRQVHRSMLHRGKITLAEYRALRRHVSVGAKDDEINAPIRRWVWAARKMMPVEPGDGPEARRIRNLIKQARLREVIYHPTKGWRFRRGGEIEASPT